MARYTPNIVDQLINACTVLHNLYLNYIIGFEEFYNVVNDEDNPNVGRKLLW